MSNGYDWFGQLGEFHGKFTVGEKKPVIGITGNFGEKGCELAQGYYQSVLKAGGIPLVIPAYEDMDTLLATLDRIDALLLSGGGDMNPLFMGDEPLPGLGGICPQRDKAELWLVRMAYNRQLPILGICRGIQMMTCALGGKVYQDLPSQYHDQPLIKHSQNLAREYASHTVQIEEESLLHRIMKDTRLAVNSFHHQAVCETGSLLKVCARSADGVIEAVESTEHKSLLGVQWHPECFVLGGDDSMMPLFEWLVKEARSFLLARGIHQRILTLDSHCDTPMCFPKAAERGFSPSRLISSRSDLALVDLHKMHEGRLDASIMVAYLPQGERDGASLELANRTAHHILDQIEEMVADNADAIGIARTPKELYDLKGQGKKALMMGVENGYAIGKDINNVEAFRKRGVVYMTLCHNGDNDICDSARGNSEHQGVSDFGSQVIKEMNRVGMMVDLSHASEKSFYDALEISDAPIVCSHSSSRALCDHPRNLTDEQMRALARKGGVAQVTFYEGFLRKDGKADILDAIAHLKHMAKVMGIEHVGIGTDFDGDGGVPGIASASEVINLTRMLLKNGFSEADLQLIWGGNFLRVMNEIQNFKS